MAAISEIINSTSHRPYEMPSGPWVYYQEWNHVLFFHYIVPFDELKQLIPEGLRLETFNGVCYISLVAFTMEKIRPRFLPALSFISDFAEINIRTYVEKDGKKGVYFLNIEAEKLISVRIAKSLSGLPYEKATMRRDQTSFSSSNSQKEFHLETKFTKGSTLQKTSLDIWLTERYCLYINKESSIYRYDIHHKEWEIKNVGIQQLHVQYQIGLIALNNHPQLTHYSDGVQVVAWKRSAAL